jgi:hypothetical protein
MSLPLADRAGLFGPNLVDLQTLAKARQLSIANALKVKGKALNA